MPRKFWNLTLWCTVLVQGFVQHVDGRSIHFSTSKRKLDMSPSVESPTCNLAYTQSRLHANSPIPTCRLLDNSPPSVNYGLNVCYEFVVVRIVFCCCCCYCFNDTTYNYYLYYYYFNMLLLSFDYPHAGHNTYRSAVELKQWSLILNVSVAARRRGG